MSFLSSLMRKQWLYHRCVWVTAWSTCPRTAFVVRQIWPNIVQHGTYSKSPFTSEYSNLPHEHAERGVHLRSIPMHARMEWREKVERMGTHAYSYSIVHTATMQAYARFGCMQCCPHVHAVEEVSN